MNNIELKQRAAKAAIEYIQPGTVIGVGAGSTVNCFIDILKDSGLGITQAVAASKHTALALSNIGIEVVSLNHVDRLSVYIDGADQIDPHGRLIKGYGGAHTFEKVLAAAAERFVCIADNTKLTKRLGKNAAIPVEVLPEARSFVARKLIGLGGQPVWRENVETDHGNVILDLHGLKLVDPVEIEIKLNTIPGVVDNGLFAHTLPHVILVTDKHGVTTTTP